MAFLGHLDPLWTLWPVGHSPQSMGPLGPFWPKSNEAKRGQGGSSSALKARWVPNHKWPQFSPWPLATTRGHQLSSKQGFPSSSGEDFSFLNAPRTQGSRSGAYIV
ncbi:hypothetical protein O181_009652 [Austropuccinia psidii MF-1]|uniref:Uncharacterized protein n=1 Tax=Austropuccinia psidii MF-1 TaxID=1389203 RepID=A0A9Q3BS70_9BASI|nr:hypothetical protein [Austropuccinia psidii MF-1]